MKKIFFLVFLIGLLAGVSLPGLAMDNPEQQATEVIKDYIVGKYPDWPKSDIRLTFKMADAAFAGLKAVPGNATLEILEVYPDFKPVGSVVFPLKADFGGESRKIMVRAKVEVVRQVAAAARFIKKGTVLEPADLKTDARDVALLPQKYFVGVDSLVGKEAKISIPENSTIFEWMVGAVALIHRGDMLTLTVSTAGLTVKTEAQAQEDGSIGSEIRVKRADSQKLITAKIISPNEAEVNL